MSMSSSKFDWLLSSLTPNESQVPSTAEIIQKCLSVNPFDLKFREANLQNQGGQPGSEHSHHQILGSSGNLPTTSGLGSVLNLPPSISSTHSPGIFSNINVLTADIEGEIRKTIDLSRKVQQLRENGLLSKQDDGQQLKTPCTSDVLNAVLDMSAAHQLGGSGQSSPFISSSSLIAGLSGLKAALTSSANQHSQEMAMGHHHQQQQHLVPTSSIPNFKLDPDGPSSISSNNNLAPSGASSSFIPVGAHGKTMSSPDLHAAGLAAAGFKQHSPVLPAEALMMFQPSASSSSMASCSSNQITTTTLTVPTSIMGGLHQQLSSLSAQSSPGGRSSVAAISPGQGMLSGGTSLAEFTPSPGGPSPHGGGGNGSICAPPQITIMEESPYSKISEPSESGKSQDGGSGYGNGRGGGGKEKHSRKFAKYANGGGSSADSQVSSTRGGRGRRSAINDMPPDERRVTILERNKAAAVRYRKRKKEEHDDMINRVHGIEQEKNALETQNSVLRRELERLTFLLQERESRCVCKANQLQVGMSMIGADESRSPSAGGGFLNGYGGGGGHPHQMRPGSSHSTQ